MLVKIAQVSILLVAVLVPAIARSQSKAQTLVVNGYAGSIPVKQMNGQTYVAVDALARLINGSLISTENQVTLTLVPTEKKSAAAGGGANPGFSREFLRAGIEAMSSIREWHSVLASALENGYPVTADALKPYEARARSDLRLAEAAASTEDDHRGSRLIGDEFQKMQQLSGNYVAKRASMTYIPPSALKDDPLNQSLLACGKSLGAMAAARQFQDDGGCR